MTLPQKTFSYFIFLWDCLPWQALSCLPISGQIQSGPVAPDAGIWLSQTPYHLTILLPLSSLQFLYVPDASENRSFVLNFQTTVPRLRKDEDQNIIFHQLYFLWMDIFLEPVEKEGGEKPTPKQTTPWPNTENAGVFTSTRMDRMSTVATTELVWIESECNISERRAVCRAGSGVRGPGLLEKSQSTLRQASDS